MSDSAAPRTFTNAKGPQLKVLKFTVGFAVFVMAVALGVSLSPESSGFASILGLLALLLALCMVPELLAYRTRIEVSPTALCLVSPVGRREVPWSDIERVEFIDPWNNEARIRISARAPVRIRIAGYERPDELYGLLTPYRGLPPLSSGPIPFSTSRGLSATRTLAASMLTVPLFLLAIGSALRSGNLRDVWVYAGAFVGAVVFVGLMHFANHMTVTADQTGLRIRELTRTTFYPWSEIRHVEMHQVGRGGIAQRLTFDTDRRSVSISSAVSDYGILRDLILAQTGASITPAPFEPAKV